MNFRDLSLWAKQAIEKLVPPDYYLHRNPTHELSEKDGGSHSLNFQEKVSRDLLNTLRIEDGKQFILRGLASEGKTTEIRRLAHSLQNKLDNPRQGFSNQSTVHLISMQNYGGVGADIATADDLWNLLISCHQARNIAHQQISFDDFSQLHSDIGHRPILLIDTLDMLAYGRDDEDVSELTEIWSELAERMLMSKMTVLWSVRPNEIDLDALGHKLEFDIIDLPKLSWDESFKLARRFVNETRGKTEQKPADDFYVFSGLLLIQYPILAKYMKTSKTRAEALRHPLYARLKQMFERFSESSAYRNVHPLDWVMSKEHESHSKDMVLREEPMGNFILDELYKLSRREILESMHSILHIPREILDEVWYNHIEVKLFDEIEDQDADFTNRLWLQKKLVGDYGNVNQIYEYMMLVGGDGSDGYGLFSIDGDQVSFQHQLFSEYAVYRGAWGEESGEIKQTAANSIPSCRLRMRAYPSDEDGDVDSQVSVFLKWFEPFFIINRDLQWLPDDAPQIIDTVPWNSARAVAIKYKEFKDQQIKGNKDLNQELEQDNVYRKASKDKQNILMKHASSTEPLSINGPAGTGKSYIANPFITGFVQRSIKTGDLNQDQKPLVKFLTLSKDLAAAFIKEHEKYMGPHESHIKLQSQPIDTMLMDLTNTVLGVNYVDLNGFSKTLLTENKFIRTLSRDIEFNRDFKGYSVYSLWHEFLDFILDENGDEVGRTNYIDLDDKNSQLAGDEQKRKEFYDHIARLDLLKMNKAKTRRKIASDIINGIKTTLIDGADFNNATLLMEQLKPYRSDVLIVDEVQDLGSAVLKLCFILHRGHAVDVAILGDREQTLSLHQFSWEDEFRIIGKSLFEMAKGAKKSQFGDLLGLEKWNHEFGGSDLSNSVKDRLDFFHVVHRNVPPIVDLMRWSFRKAAITPHIDEELVIPKGGTADIETSTKRREEYELWKENHDDASEDSEGKGIPQGVFFIGDIRTGKPTKISLKELIQIIKIASFSEEPIEIILPDEHHRKIVEDELKSAEEGVGIQQTVWDPVSIKGLENRTIIAVSPWSIHNDRLKIYVKPDKNPEVNTWKHLVGTVPPRKRKKFVKIIEQRRRHANVMLSRPKNTLFVLNLDSNLDDEVALTDTTEPDFPSILQDAEAANLMALVDTVEELRACLEGPGGDVLKNPSRHMELLEKLIQQSRGLEQIGIKALQIYNIAAGLIEESPELHQFIFAKFRTINQHNDLADNTGSDATIGIQHLERILFHKEYRSHNLMAYDNGTISPLQQAFDDWQIRFFKLSDSFVFNNASGPKLQYSTEAYDALVALFNEFVDDFSSFREHEKFQQFEVIKAYVHDEIFGGKVDTSASKVWFERARKMSLRIMQMEHLITEASEQHLRMDRLLNMMAWFKQEYYNEIHAKFSNDDKKAKRVAMLTKRGYESSAGQDQLTKLRPYHDRQLDELVVHDLPDSEHHSAFWGDGINFIKFNEFSDDQMEKLEGKFFDLLNENEEPADNEPWLTEQIEWLFHLLVHVLGRTNPISDADVEECLHRLVDLERYGEVIDLASNRYSLQSMVANDAATLFWAELQTGGGRIDDRWSKMLRKNHFGIFSFVQHEMAYVAPKKEDKNVILMQRFYQTAALISCLDSFDEAHPVVKADIDQKIGEMCKFISHPGFLDLSSIAVNSDTIIRYHQASASGLFGQQFSRMLNQLEPASKARILEHVLGVYIGAHSPLASSNSGTNNSLQVILRTQKGMGLIPEVTVGEFITEVFGEDRKLFGDIINNLYPIHSLEERGTLYYPVHVKKEYTETPTMVYDTDGLILASSLKNQRTSWLSSSLAYAFEEELCDLNHVEDHAIYTLGLNEFAQIIRYLPRAPTRFGTFAKVWSRDLHPQQIHQQYVRYFIDKFIEDSEWVNTNYELIDRPDNVDNMRVFLGNLQGIGLQFELDRYLQIERFSRFLRAHISDLPTYGGRDLYQKEIAAFEELFGVNSLIRRLVDTWVEWEEGESAGISTIIEAFWKNVLIAVPPGIDISLPKSIEGLFKGCECAFSYGKVLGNKDDEIGFYGAARKLLSMFTGTTQVGANTLIKCYVPRDVAPGSGSGQLSVGDATERNLQQTVLSQFNYLKWSARDRRPMAELNRLSKAGEIMWYEGFTVTDLGQSPFDDIVHAEEE